ncbi:hypothetical protein [Arthrobacter sp. KK5.5]|uniref:hypothetical protein n=1 Tax=Arthrobacter sp. KK5.5 TaxID=3373084 RepID=UPI003EE6C164
MNTRFAAILLALILLAGCAAPEADTEQAAEATTASASPSASPSASAIDAEEPAFRVSRQTTCTQLLGQNEGGPFYRTIDFVNEFQDIDDATITKSRGLKDEVDSLALHAEEDLTPFLESFASPMTEMIEITEGGGTTYNFDATEFKAAGTELVNLCTPYFSGSGQTEVEPQPVPTTGDYAADLAAIGVVPDDATSYGQFLENNLCTDDPTEEFSDFKQIVRVSHDGDPALGNGAETLRLAVAYFCPERAGHLEDAIEEAIARGM